MSATVIIWTAVALALAPLLIWLSYRFFSWEFKNLYDDSEYRYRNSPHVSDYGLGVFLAALWPFTLLLAACVGSIFGIGWCGSRSIKRLSRGPERRWNERRR